MQITIKELRSRVKDAINERAGDIEFSAEANKIYQEILSKVTKRAFAVLKPNIDDEFLSQWNGVHVSASDLGIDSLPEVLDDLVLVFAWGTPEDPISSASYNMPNEEFPSGILIIGYNVDPPKGAITNKSKSVKQMSKTLDTAFKDAVLEADLDIVPFVSQLLSAKKSPFVHELRHAYDMLVRDDDGKMAQHMHSLSQRLEAGEEELNFTGDDEMNAYIVMTIEDTIDDFKKISRGKPSKLKAQKWAPNGTALWNKFMQNLSTNIKTHVDEPTLLRKAAGRVKDVWDNYVAELPEK